MPGRGPAPKPERRRRNAPVRGAWQATPGVGWQHGEVPAAPDGLLGPSQAAWTVWMRSWWASHWTPDNLPDLRTCIRLYDQVECGDFQRVGELRMWEDNLGITPKGQQDRRWSPPKAEEQAAAPTANAPSRYANLKVV